MFLDESERKILIISLKVATPSFVVFANVNSKKLLHYVDPTLEEEQYNTAILHVGVNNLMNSKANDHFDK